jgi:hypothetical protein
VRKITELTQNLVLERETYSLQLHIEFSTKLSDKSMPEGDLECLISDIHSVLSKALDIK